MKAIDFGIEADFVRAPYNTLEEAETQAEHNLKTGKQVPLRIVDEQGENLIDYEE